MKKGILNNFGIKILAIVCAIILWIVVMNISDYTVTVEINDIPVVQLNGDVLEEKDQIYEVSKGDTVDIIVKGRRSIVDTLTADDFIATADLATMSITNAVQINVNAKNGAVNSDISINYVNNTMILNLEERVSKQFPITVYASGETEDGYTVGALNATPNILTVEGPESSIEKITEARAKVNVTARKDDFSEVSEVLLYDAYDNQIISEKITVNYTEVDVIVQIVPTKTVEIVVDVKGIPEAGYQVSEVNYQPQTIMVAGEADDIDSIEEISVNNISVSGWNENLETTVDLLDYLPKNVIVTGGDSDIVVSIIIEKLETHTFKASAKNIKLLKLDGFSSPVECDLEISDDFKIIANGLPEVVSGLTITDIAPSIDASNLVIGTNQAVEVQLKEIDGIKYTIEGTINAVISVKQ